MSASANVRLGAGQRTRLPRLTVRRWLAFGALMAITCLPVRIVAAQSSTDPVWGLYASYTGVPPMFSDPCNITYTVAPIMDPRIGANVAAGTMVPIVQGVPRAAAQARLKLHGRYFDDKPDDIVKLGPCESKLEDLLKEIAPLFERMPRLGR